MDFIDLPEELVEAVAEYLSFEDLCACSTVNPQWRNAFDINRIWRRFRTYHKDYFKQQISKVKSTLSKDVDQSCETKKVVFQEHVVEKHMMQGKFYISEVNCGDLYIDNLLDGVDELGNHWMFVSCMNGLNFQREHKLKVWNMNDDPILHACVDSPLGQVARMLQTDMQFDGSKFFFIYSDTIFVYEFVSPLYELNLLHNINCTPEVKFPDSTFFDFSLTQVGKLFLGFFYMIGHVTHTAPPFFQVWNEEGTLIFKDYSFLPQVMEDTYPYIHPILHITTNGSDKVLVAVQRFNKETNSRFFTIMLFSVSCIAYTNCNLHECRFFLSFDICGNIASVFYSNEGCRTTHFKCYNTENGTAIFEAKNDINGDCLFHLFIPGCVDKELLVLEKANTFCLFDIKTRQELKRFSLSGKVCILNVTLLNRSHMVIEYTKKDTIAHEIWNFKTGQKLYPLSLSTTLGMKLYCNQNSFIKSYRSPPKLISFKDPVVAYPHENKNTKIIVINFW